MCKFSSKSGGVPFQISFFLGDLTRNDPLVNNPVYHQRTKHIDIRYHFIREQVHDKCINVEYLPTSLMIADC